MPKLPTHRLAGPQIAAAACCWIGLSLPCSCWADDAAETELFEKRIRPVLVQSCYSCHSAEADEPEGGLRLDSRELLRRGGESGPAVIPGKPAESLLLSALRYESLQMPPNHRLPDEVIDDFVQWIQRGAVDPRDHVDRAGTAAQTWPEILAARRDWWSLQPVLRPDPPPGNDWSDRDIDRFVFARLAEAGLRPAAPATPRQLIRRLSLVLSGLPPSAADVETFESESLNDPETAYRSLVDRLLDAPQFGERWARHWLDVVRFTETHGNEWNYEVHHAWRYRDYVIRAFNSDLPYDDFVREQIAGDLLEAPRWNDDLRINESLIGTSFYRFGEVNHDDCVSLTALGYDILDNQIDTLSKAFQATTIACARCHDHKIDAVSMEDYYALLGILKSSRPAAHTIDADSVNQDTLARLNLLKAELQRSIADRWLQQTDAMPSYLLAADAQLRQAPDAAALADSLDQARLGAWVRALQVEAPSCDHPLWLWHQVSASSDVAAGWRQAATTFAATKTANDEFNRANFTKFADFSEQQPTDWQSSGQGLRGGPSPSGDFTVAHEGDRVVAAFLPAGRFTHSLSQKLNGAIRSPVVPPGFAYVSARVCGEKSSALRLVSNNCQLNYANYRALTSAVPAWVTFAIPEDSQTLGSFLELLTKFDNPKFPDQLGTLGGDTANHRVPWAEAAADPRSYFGVQQVVLHNDAAAPKADLAPLSRLFDANPPNSLHAVAAGYARAVRASIAAWSDNSATDADAFWLSWICQHGLQDDSVAASQNLAELVADYRAAESEIERPRLAPGMADRGEGRDHPLLARGDFRAPLQIVPRGYLSVLSTESAPSPATSSGRRQLAEAIASPANPLTGRVMVNRIWHHLFGTGLVPTVDNFGRVGALPSHPKLLDYLTAQFTADRSADGMGWSIKRLIRQIVLSETFRMSSRADLSNREIDPHNQWLHHYPSRRLEAEAIRDSILLVSGRLRTDLYGPSVDPHRAESNEHRRLFAGPLDGDGRRSLYIKVNLMEQPEFLSAFDTPGGKVTRGSRDTTNVPSQALTLLNDRFVLLQADVWARRLMSEGPPAGDQRLEAMFLAALGRHPSAEELSRFRALADRLAELHQDDASAVWQDIAHVMFNLKEFIYIP